MTNARPVGARRGIQGVLGVIWLLDAALQFQPYMFTRAFATRVIEPAAAGSPGFVARPVLLAGHLIQHNPAAFDAVFATVQLAIGLGLLWRPTVRVALIGSMAWALSIWWLGEGLGQVFTGTASPVTGAPGAAVLYALIAVLAWPSRAQAGSVASGSVASGSVASGSVASGSPLGGRWSRLAWLALWGSGACFLLLAASRAAGALRDSIAGGAAGEPAWLASAERGAATSIGPDGGAISVTLAVVFAVIALGILVPAATRPVLVLAVIVAAACWVLGQSFGGIATGQATDPNSGLPLILLAATYWPPARSSRRSSRSTAAAMSGPAAMPAAPVVPPAQ